MIEVYDDDIENAVGVDDIDVDDAYVDDVDDVVADFKIGIIRWIICRTHLIYLSNHSLFDTRLKQQ